MLTFNKIAIINVFNASLSFINNLIIILLIYSSIYLLISCKII